MKALHIQDGNCRLVQDAERPEPKQGWTRVAVTSVGVCATDLALWRGYMGFRGIPGHEFVGRALDGPLVGQRVVGEINAGCGDCDLCRSGDARHCSTRSVLGILGAPGAFAEELRLPDENLFAVPAGVTDDAAVFAEPLAAALAVAREVPHLPAGRALVVGDGRLGLLIAGCLALEGREVDLAGRHPGRERLLFGEGSDAHTRLRHLGSGLGEASGPGSGPQQRYALVVEASGRPEVLPLALGAVEPRGTLVLKSTAERPAELDLSSLVVDEIRLVGSRCGRFAPALELLEAAALDPRPMIEARFGLDAAPDALELSLIHI